MTTLETYVERIRKRVDAVIEMDTNGADPETAHADQDFIWAEVLIAVAGGHPDSQGLAVEAVRLVTSGGERWYA